MLNEKTLFGIDDKVQQAIELLKNYEPPEGYYLAFSGGKDSVVIYALAEMSGVKYDAHYNNTTIDPPELRPFIKENYPRVEFHRDGSFFQLLIKKGFPLRQARWCCEKLKEKGGTGRFVMTGIRAEESGRRAKRKQIEHCFDDKKHKIGIKKYIHPIFYWTEKEVWEFIKQRHIPYCSLYDQGWKRIGCIACPMQTVKRRQAELLLYPKMERAFRLAFNKLWIRKNANNDESIKRWKNGDEMFDWWITNKDESDNIKNNELGLVFEDQFEKDEGGV